LGLLSDEYRHKTTLRSGGNSIYKKLRKVCVSLQCTVLITLWHVTISYVNEARDRISHSCDHSSAPLFDHINTPPFVFINKPHLQIHLEEQCLVNLSLKTNGGRNFHLNNSGSFVRRLVTLPSKYCRYHTIYQGTEMAGTGKYDKVYTEGIYSCAGCGTPLYKSATKFNSGCGWPAFFDGMPQILFRGGNRLICGTLAIPGAINRHEDKSFFTTRTEITCAACGGHLGHVFKGEGFDTPSTCTIHYVTLFNSSCIFILCSRRASLRQFDLAQL
jgi:peptide-methionine (R)-S-oxide reductase